MFVLLEVEQHKRKTTHISPSKCLYPLIGIITSEPGTNQWPTFKGLAPGWSDWMDGWRFIEEIDQMTPVNLPWNSMFSLGFWRHVVQWLSGSLLQVNRKLRDWCLLPLLPAVSPYRSCHAGKNYTFLCTNKSKHLALFFICNNYMSISKKKSLDFCRQTLCHTYSQQKVRF